MVNTCRFFQDPCLNTTNFNLVGLILIQLNKYKFESTNKFSNFNLEIFKTE